MGKVFTLTPSIKAVIQDALDDLITELGKNCVLYYTGKATPCTNCCWDPIGQSGGLIWKDGGPEPFPNGTICPMCNGKSMRYVETSESVKMLCAWEPKNFWNPIPNLDIRVPFSYVQTKGYFTDLPKINKANWMLFESAVEGLQRMKYTLLKSPGDQSNIIQGRYFIATWQQVG